MAAHSSNEKWLSCRQRRYLICRQFSKNMHSLNYLLQRRLRMKRVIKKHLPATLGLALTAALAVPATSYAGEPALLQGLGSNPLVLSEQQKAATRGEFFSSRRARDAFCIGLAVLGGANGSQSACKSTGSSRIFGSRRIYWAKLTNTSTRVKSY